MMRPRSCRAPSEISETYVVGEFDGQKHPDLVVRRCLVENDLLLGGTRRHGRQLDPKPAQGIITPRKLPLLNAMYLTSSRGAE